jgi:DNA-binding MarR family transcriptional regulator
MVAPSGSVEELLQEAKALANQLRKMSTTGNSELPLALRKLLQILCQQGPQSVPQLARLALTSRQNIQFAVNRLKSAGYVTLVQNPAHKRSSIVVLTQKGESLVAANLPNEFSDLGREFSPERLAAAIGVLREVRLALSEQNRTARNGQPRKPRTPIPPVPSALDKAAEEEELPVSLL